MMDDLDPKTVCEWLVGSLGLEARKIPEGCAARRKAEARCGMAGEVLDELVRLQERVKEIEGAIRGFLAAKRKAHDLDFNQGRSCDAAAIEREAEQRMIEVLDSEVDDG